MRNKKQAAEFIARIKAYGDELHGGKQTIKYGGKTARFGKHEIIPKAFWK